jgi:hypothetical protein
MVKFEFVDTNIQSRLKRNLDRMVQKLGVEVYTEVRAKTPVDTGRAKRGWNLKNTKSGFEIENQVPYVGVLDRGRHMTNRGMRGSKQAPKGIVGPSLKTIKGKN